MTRDIIESDTAELEAVITEVEEGSKTPIIDAMVDTFSKAINDVSSEIESLVNKNIFERFNMGGCF